MAMAGWLRGEVLRGEAVFFSISCRIGGPRPDEAAAGAAATVALAVRIVACSSSGGVGLRSFGVDERELTSSGADAASEGADAMS